MPRFEDALDVSPLDDGRNWLVREAFYYDTDIILTPSYLLGILSGGVREFIVSGNGTRKSPYAMATRISVPQGFITDFASVPRLLWRLLPPTGRYTRAAVVHDFLYRTPGLCTRAQADAVLYEAMKFPCHVGFFTRWAIYLGVRIGGGFSYKGGL